MRRPVGVEWVLLFFRWTRFFCCRVATVATLPSALFIERFSLGASWVFSFQPVLPPDFRPLLLFLRMEVGQAIDAVIGIRRLGFCVFLSQNVLPLCGRRHRHPAAVAQRFVRFSTYPQTMQQHCQLSCGGDHGSFLSVLPATFRPFQPPAPQVAVRSQRTQDVMRPLPQQCSQIRSAFPSDVHLRFALPGVSPSPVQSHIAAHAAALARITVRSACAFALRCFTGHSNCGSIRANRASVRASSRSSFFRLSPIKRTLRACATITSCPNSLSTRLTQGECIPVSNAMRQRGIAPNTSRTAFGVVPSFCSCSTSPTSSIRHYHLDRSPRSRRIVSVG